MCFYYWDRISLRDLHLAPLVLSLKSNLKKWSPYSLLESMTSLGGVGVIMVPWVTFSQFQFFTKDRENVYAGEGTGVHGSCRFQESLAHP